MMQLSAVALHATAASFMTWGWFSVLDVPTVQLMVAEKGGPFVYLTNQGLLLAWICMTVSLFCDVFPSAVGVIRPLKRTLLMISMPISFIIFWIYWPSRLFLPQLTSDVPLTDVPLMIDLAVHASPFLTLLIDFFVFEPKFSKTCIHKVAPVAAVISTIWYASFVEYRATSSGTFPYPFLTNNPFSIRVLIYILTVGISLGCFSMLNALHA